MRFLAGIRVPFWSIRSLPAFSRFLDVAALSDTEPVNFSNIARECGVSSPTVKGYFGILEDTLLGRWLPAWRERRKRRLIGAPKFYFADAGVVNRLARRGTVHRGSELYGKAFENWVHHELAAFVAYTDLDAELRACDPPGTQGDRRSTAVSRPAVSPGEWRVRPPATPGSVGQPASLRSRRAGCLRVQGSGGQVAGPGAGDRRLREDRGRGVRRPARTLRPGRSVTESPCPAPTPYPAPTPLRRSSSSRTSSAFRSVIGYSRIA